MQVPPRPRTVGLVLVLLALATLTTASSGDRHPTFHACHAQCLPHCTPTSLSLPLRLLRWSCADNCAYLCSHALTDAADAGTEHYHQFFGKWAFHRFLGAQEPASVLFSLGNLWVHLQGWQLASTRLRASNGLRPWLLLAAAAQVNTWIWSAVFHTRDVWWTERGDYFSATVTIAVTLLYAILRVLGLQTARTTSPMVAPVCGILALVVLGHFVYVSSLDHFPYGYHVAFAAGLGMLGNLLWIAWSVSFVARPSFLPAPYPASTKPLSKTAGVTAAPTRCWTPAILVVLTLAAMSLEILDFPPYARALDAHALWHAATIPLGMGWWRFLVRDAAEMDALEDKEGRE